MFLLMAGPILQEITPPVTKASSSKKNTANAQASSTLLTVFGDVLALAGQ
jgi:hypothetical protein